MAAIIGAWLLVLGVFRLLSLFSPSGFLAWAFVVLTLVILVRDLWTDRKGRPEPRDRDERGEDDPKGR